MSATHTEHQNRKHGSDLGHAIESVDAHTVEESAVDPVPAPDAGPHSHSPAAHLGEIHDRTKPEGNLRQGSEPGALRQPPEEMSRAGKQHRKQ